jgi:hypothetical protein
VEGEQRNLAWCPTPFSFDNVLGLDIPANLLVLADEVIE